jgi:hypothetical protein
MKETHLSAFLPSHRWAMTRLSIALRSQLIHHPRYSVLPIHLCYVT